MQDLVPSLLLIVLGLLLLGLIAARYSQREVGLLFLSLAAHATAGIAQVVITQGLYGYGDILGYARKGEELAAAMRADFLGVGVELVKVLFQQQGFLPISVAGVGSSTGTMTAVAAFLCFFTGGTVYTCCIFLSIASFFGELAIYEVFRLNFPERLRGRLLFATLLMPSVVFWSSGLLKESVAMIGLGPVMLGAQLAFHRRPLSGSVLIIFGAVVIGIVKAYILFAFALGAGAWLFATLAGRGRVPTLRPVHLIAGIGVATLCLVLLGKIFPQYALESLAEQAALQQEVGQRIKGGSTYTLVSDPSEATVAVQLGLAPLALLTSLYRPLIIEASSPQILVNALETTGLLVVTLMALSKLSLRSFAEIVLSSPVGTFCVVFVFVFGIAVGLASTNLGTLSRYRMPLVPFLTALLVVLLDAAKSKASNRAPIPPAMVRGRVGPLLPPRRG